MSNIGDVRTYLRENWYDVLVWGVFIAASAVVLLFHLNRLTHGISGSEARFVGVPALHHLLRQPLNVPLQLPQLVLIKIFGVGHLNHFARLSNVLLGFVAILALTRLVYLWHGHRSALMAGCLFAASAWTLHVSRFSSADVLYLSALPLLLLIQAVLHRSQQSKVSLYVSALVWSALLTVPGLIWCVLLSLFWIRADLKRGWKALNGWWRRPLFVICALLWVPLVGIAVRNGYSLATWLGVPRQIATNSLPKQLAAVPVHLFLRGPEYPQLWLGRLPILDIASLVLCLIGIYFYVRHWHASRTRILFSFIILGIVLIGVGGPVPLSLLVPLLYVFIGTGLTYLIRQWLHVFPSNPVARNFGIGLLSLVIAVSCLYNLRSYFIAWPHDPATVAFFHSRR